MSRTHTLLILFALVTTSALPQDVDGVYKITNCKTRTSRAVESCFEKAPAISWHDEITLTVEYLPSDEVEQPELHDLVLFLDGRPLEGLHPRIGNSTVDPDSQITTTDLVFHVQRSASSPEARKQWTDVLTAASNGNELSVSTGLPRGAALPSDGRITFTSTPEKRVVWSVVVVLLLAGLFVLLAATTGTLRDKEPPDGAVDARDRAYSLSRLQLGFWIFLSVAGFTYIWMVTGDFNGLFTNSILAILGISSGTMMGSVAIDSTKSKDAAKQLQALPPPSPVEPAHVTALRRDLTATATVAKNENWFRDILTGADGASLHRVQLLVWTVLLGMIFAMTVVRTLSMPDFDTALLGLMGISAGTYVGLKVPERKQ